MLATTPRLRALMVTAGGRTGVRRRSAVRRLVLALVLLLPLTVSAWAAGDPDNDGETEVTVEEAEGLYTITARFTVPAPPAIVLEVLTDYDDIPRFLPNVRASRLVERQGGHALVEQEAVVKLMFFSTRIHLLLSIDEGPRSLRFVDRSGKSFTRYEGAWTVVERGDLVEVRYTLTANPSFEAPGFLIRRLMQRDASDQIRRLRREMTIRTAEAP
jgi:ribosome-associated toxin RatA of RatAB toxin-antitoxin module